MTAGEFQRRFVAHAKRELAVLLDGARAISDCHPVVEEDRLRELDDRAAGKAREHFETKVLVGLPERTEIAAAMEEDRPLRQRRFERIMIVRADRAYIDRSEPSAAEVRGVAAPEIGRASSRERGCRSRRVSGVAVPSKKKKK